mgnify:CR=1 FL=1
MENSELPKEIVREKYSEIALKDKETNQSSCYGSGYCTTEIYNIMNDEYTSLDDCFVVKAETREDGKEKSNSCYSVRCSN